MSIGGFPAALCVSAFVLMVAATSRAATFEEALAADRPGNEQVAFQGYREAAENGEAPAEYALGRMYLEGRGATQSDVQALIWFRMAAQQGNPAAEFEVSVMSRAGRGGPNSAAETTEWLEKAAAAGFAPAELDLSTSYERGEGVGKDFDQALYWATKAAEQGDVDAQFAAGRLYEEAARTGGRTGSLTSSQFYAIMNSVFGEAKWRETSGYRTRSREDELRREGAGTVPLGALSRHSIGTPAAPGAYDVVVADLPTEKAAVRLWNSGLKFRRIVVEGAHGPEGPHLHIEPWLVADKSGSNALPSKLSYAEGTSEPQAERASAYKQAFYWLDMAAKRGSTEAKVMLTRIGVPPATP